MEKEIDQRTENFVGWYTTMAHNSRFCGRMFRKEVGLGLTQIRILFFLKIHEGATMSEVSESLCLERSTVTAAIDQLEKQELMQRVVDGNDARVVRGYVTDNSNEVFERGFQLYGTLYDELCERVRPGKYDELVEILSNGVSYKSGQIFRFRQNKTYEETCQLLNLDPQDKKTEELIGFISHFERTIVCYNNIHRIGKAFGLGYNTGLALSYLAAVGGKARLQPMRDYLRLESGEMTVCLDRLERDRLVSRSIDRKDRRCIHVTMTKAGRAVIANAIVEVAACFDKVFPGVLDYNADEFLSSPMGLLR